MTEPTLKSRNEAAYLAGLDTWENAQAGSGSVAIDSIRAHALTLDELHARKEVSEAEALYREVITVSGWQLLNDGRPLGGLDHAAIALIDAKFAELRAPKEHEWIEWPGGECPVASDVHVEVKFRDGLCSSEYKAGTWNWKNLANDDEIIAYRVLS